MKLNFQTVYKTNKAVSSAFFNSKKTSFVAFYGKDTFTKTFVSPNPNVNKLHKIFKKHTGLNLYIPIEQEITEEQISNTIRAINSAVKHNKFPKDIKNIIIAHGQGSVAHGNWKFKNNLSVFSWINNYIQSGEKCIVGVCEDSNGKIKTIGIGTGVDSTFMNRNRPAKIIISGQNKIIGTYTLQDGAKYYR